jgi:L-asparaginase
LARLLLLHTGGTFGMRPSAQGAELEPAPDLAGLLAQVPELTELAEIEARTICNLDSSDLGPDHWTLLAREIAAGMNAYDGFVVTHGTDTMVYTAAALSFALRELPKPVILTGSQRPMLALRSDARLNLANACAVASRPVREVAICFDDLLLRGNRAKKLAIADYRAFSSPNYPPLAKLGLHLELDRARIRAPAGPFTLVEGFAREVFHLKLFPGLAAAAARLAAEQARGVLLEGFGAGNLPSFDPEWRRLLQQWRERGKVVAMVSPCPQGRVDMSLYPGGRQAIEAGVVGAADMTAEAALVKLMHLLARESDPDRVRESLGIDLAGELTQ